ncbi:MAG: shikimate kinase [Acidimicrobiia bacterium]
MPSEPDPPAPGANIVLTGFMGTGKSTVGRLVAERLGRDHVDTDALIESRHGPIAELFSTHGEDHFRRLERQVAAELATRSGLVVSTGGRTMLDPENQATLGTTGVVVCLSASVAELVERLRDEADHRPLLRDGDPAERIAALLAERASGYGRFPQVATDGLTPDEVAEAVIVVAGA